MSLTCCLPQPRQEETEEISDEKSIGPRRLKAAMIENIQFDLIESEWKKRGSLTCCQKTRHFSTIRSRGVQGTTESSKRKKVMDIGHNTTKFGKRNRVLSSWKVRRTACQRMSHERQVSEKEGKSNKGYSRIWRLPSFDRLSLHHNRCCGTEYCHGRRQCLGEQTIRSQHHEPSHTIKKI